jgi:hypothetical protein
MPILALDRVDRACEIDRGNKKVYKFDRISSSAAIALLHSIDLNYEDRL